MAHKRHEKTSCMRINFLFPSSQIELSLMFFIFLHLKSGDMPSACIDTFAQSIARTIVQFEVAVAHEGVDFQSMKVVVLPCLYTLVNFSFPFQLVLGTQTKKPIRIALSELDKESAAHFAFEYFARVPVSPPSQVVSKLYA
jgi:hypothetical protein